MANAAYSPDQHLTVSTIRADLPQVVEISPDMRDGMVAIGGSALVALAAALLANWLMLPFG